MTANQIAYYSAQALRQHQEGSRKIEQLKAQSLAQYQAAQAGIGWSNLAELQTHNRNQESIDFYKAQNLGHLQTAQAEKASSEIGVQSQLAGIQQQQVDESRRHSMAMEGISSAEQLERARHNKEVEWTANFKAGVDAGSAAIRGIFGVTSLLK